MELNTAAAVISYVSKLELESAKFYEKWAGVHEKLQDIFSRFVKDNKKNETNIRRIYYGVVSDALETGFSFKGLTAEVFIPIIPEDATTGAVVRASLKMEKDIQTFYEKAATLSRSLLADVPRALERAAKMRQRRQETLSSLLNQS